MNKEQLSLLVGALNEIADLVFKSSEENMERDPEDRIGYDECGVVSANECTLEEWVADLVEELKYKIE